MSKRRNTDKSFLADNSKYLQKVKNTGAIYKKMQKPILGHEGGLCPGNKLLNEFVKIGREAA